MLSLSPTEADVFRTLRTFLLGILPSGDAVFAGSIVGNQLTVATIAAGTIKIGDAVLGENV
jgi:predicted exporter